MSSTTGTSGLDDFSSVTVDDMLAAMAKLAAIPKNDKWILVDPQGRMYTGTAEQVLPVVLSQHRLLKPPPFPFDYQGA